MKRRAGTFSAIYERRIPRDIQARVVAHGYLDVPVGDMVVPVRLRPTTRTIRTSLRTSDPNQAQHRTAIIDAYLEGVWQAVRGAPEVTLSSGHASFLGRNIYKELADGHERTYGRDFARPVSNGTPQAWDLKGTEPEVALDLLPPDSWAAMAHAIEQFEDKPELLFRRIDALLLRQGVGHITEASRYLVARAVIDAYQKGYALRGQHANNNFTADPAADSFVSAWPDLKGRAALPFQKLLDGWWSEAKLLGRSEGTYSAYKFALGRLERHLGHDDATLVTPADIAKFKEARLQGGASPETIRSVDLGSFRTLFGWAVDNKKLRVNPALGVKVPRIAKSQTRVKNFTEAEVASILQLTLQPYEGRAIYAGTLRARRWVPWLCAYTGSRVGEILQLRAEDFSKVGGVWVMRITPEAGTVKGKRFRDVVIHEHLLEQGLVAMVEGVGSGYLFIPEYSRDKLRGAVSNIGSWVRQVLKGSEVAPNHGWRHLFKTVGREAGIADSVLDAICGHAPRTVGEGYGSVTIKTQVLAMEKFPRFIVSTP